MKTRHICFAGLLVAVFASWIVAQAPVPGISVSGGGPTLGANTFTGTQAFPQGLIGAPSIVFGSDTTSGFYQTAANTYTWVSGGANYWSQSVNRTGMSTGNIVCWSATANSTAACDVNLVRSAAGQVAIGTGGGGSGGSLALTNIAYTATAFASLGTPANGIVEYCNDCTVAATCAGSGTGAIAKRLNGAWVCN